MASKPAKVAVIGAGVTGLAVLRHLASEPELFTPVAFELRAEVGGIWVYTEDRGVDCRGYPTHNNMYDAVVCNLAKEVMCSEECPIDPALPSFLNRQQYHQHLLDYTNKFDLYKYIKLQTRVVKVSPIKTGDSLQWQVTTETADYEVPGKNIKTEIYDYVLVCNGNYAMPRTPNSPGLSTFKGRVVHSGTYRRPEDLAGERVLVVGGGYSGAELSCLITTSAKRVYHSYRDLMYRGEGDFPDNLERIQSGVKEVKEHSVVLQNGQELEVDVIFYCIGFAHAFPFLSEECQVTVDPKGCRVSPLYKYMFHADFPSLAFLGLRPIYPVATFILAYKQIQYFIAVHKGKVQLPNKAAMALDIARDDEINPPESYNYQQVEIWLVNDEAEYVAGLAKEGGFEPYPAFVAKLWEHIVLLFLNSHQPFDWFRRFQYKITPGRDNFVISMTDE